MDYDWHEESAVRAAAKAEAARILQARTLTPEQLREHAHNPRTFAGCSGACNQGRKLCPVPTACGMPDAEPLTWRDFWLDCPMGMRIGIVIVGVILLVVAAPHVAARLGVL